MFAFEKSGTLSRNRDEKLDDFFNEQDIVTSVVRESLQNILDAPAFDDRPVIARYSLKEMACAVFKAYTMTDEGKYLDDHLNSPTLGRHAQTFEGQSVRYLLVEDYNTTGLTGDFDKNVPNSDSKLVNFWWNSGKGNKGRGGSNGSAGVGKICFIAASGMRTMWGVSNRLDDTQFPKVLIGTTDLPNHHVDGISYIGGAQYGQSFTDPTSEINSGSDPSYEPIIDTKDINEFEKQFGINRNEPGLSIVIPAVTEEITPSSIIAAVLREYFWAIINQNLVVEVTHEDGTVTALRSETLAEQLKVYSPQDQNFAKKVELAVEAKLLMSVNSRKVFRGLEPIADSETGKLFFPKSQITEENLVAMRNYFDQGEMISLQFAIPFFDLVEQKAKTGLLNLVYKRLDSREKAPKEFIRRSISLTQLERAMSRNLPDHMYCFLFIEDKELSDFVVSAEDAAHIKLTKQKFNKEKKFSPVEALSFIMEIDKIMFSILNRSDEETELIENFADDIFSVELPDPENNAGQTKQQRKKKKTRDPKPEINQKAEQIYSQKELTEGTGFEVFSLDTFGKFIENDTLTLPVKISIKSAYQTINGPSEAWKYYSKNDFEIGKDISVQCEPADRIQVLESTGNSLLLEVDSPKFNIKVSGFDENRDLVTKVRSVT
jgi:hypothetical protein